MTNYNLLEYLADLPDPRRGQGQRHPLSSFLAMLIMAIISGHQGIRGFVRFMKVHESTFIKLFQLKHGVPSYGTTHTLMSIVEQPELADRFGKWMQQYFPSDSELWLTLDGKVLGSTVEDAQGSQQNFINMVSVFAQHSGLVHAQASFNSGKSYEPRIVRQLIAQLGLKDAVFTMDALHCQKKH